MMEPQNLTDGGAQLRSMSAADLEQVLEIEQRNFSEPWTRRAFLAEIETKPISQPLVAVYNDQIIGYVVPWFIVDEVQIADIAVHKDFRRRGLARRMVAQVCELAQRRGCRIAHLEVSSTNAAGRKLYESTGFYVTGVRRDYYGIAENALLMSKNLIAEENQPQEKA
jgi:ribosomal-protein-alanine N-acetyltransferase